jgi:hypothetical protein
MKARFHSLFNLRIPPVIITFALVISLSGCATENAVFTLSSTGQMQNAILTGRRIDFCLKSHPCDGRASEHAIVAKTDDRGFTSQAGERFMYADIKWISYQAPALMGDSFLFLAPLFPVGR